MKLSMINVFCFLWIIVFLIYYVMGSRGVLHVRSMMYVNDQLDQEIELMKYKVTSLQKILEQWHNDPFLKEQLAREQLQLVYPGDTVYYITE